MCTACTGSSWAAASRRAIAGTQFGAPNALHTALTGRENQPSRFPRAALRLPGAIFDPSLWDERPPFALQDERPAQADRPIETASSI
jgi:hypothetical protein